jgi:hypothetical protein
MKSPLVSIVVIHYGDVRYLVNCLESIKSSTYKDVEVIVVDNNPSPVSTGFPVPVNEYIHNGRNYGFARACNIGINASRGEYVFILNNDITLDAQCIEALLSIALGDERVAVVQPKMLDMRGGRLFHSSAGGGMMDVFGYPFARGRIFDHVEVDRGQYDDAIEVFWCSGAALFARRSVLMEAGLFDEDFFLYMEEIDLQWRIHLLGYKIVYTPRAVIYHEGAPNLKRDSIERMYYVHRNSLLMLLKNTPGRPLYIILPSRMILEASSIIISILSLRPKRAFAILKGILYILQNLPSIREKRASVKRLTRISYKEVYQKMYHGSVMIKYFLLKKRAFLQLNISVNKYGLMNHGLVRDA